jgi:predicted enzyme related to lactoylglutathione lyase
MKIGAIVYYVQDLKRSEKFYRDTLGVNVTIRPTGDPSDPDEMFMMGDIGDITLVFFQKPEKPGKTPIIVFNLDEGGIDNVIEDLARKGVTIVTPVSEAPGGWSADWTDPVGHMFSHYQSGEKPRRKHG